MKRAGAEGGETKDFLDDVKRPKLDEDEEAPEVIRLLPAAMQPPRSRFPQRILGVRCSVGVPS